MVNPARPNRSAKAIVIRFITMTPKTVLQIDVWSNYGSIGPIKIAAAVDLDQRIGGMRRVGGTALRGVSAMIPATVRRCAPAPENSALIAEHDCLHDPS